MTSPDARMDLTPDDRVRHRGCDQYGVYAGPAADPADAWVLFDGELNAEIVSRGQLAKVSREEAS